MRTVTYKSVLEGVAKMLSIDPDTGAYDDVLVHAIGEFVGQRLPEGWQWDWWPEITHIEQRQYRADYAAGTTYAVGEIVYYEAEDTYYECIVESTGNLPTDTDYWEEAADWERYVAVDQSWEDNEIGEVRKVYKSNPRITRYPHQLGFKVTDNGVMPSLNAGTTIWIEFREPTPEFTTTEYAAATTYAIGDRVYYPTTGESYVCVQAGSGNDPTDTDYWTKVDFPAFLAKWAKRAAYADMLREDGQNEKATREDAMAYDELMRLRDVLLAGQEQTERMPAVSYGS